MIDFHIPADWQSAGLWYPVINKNFKGVDWKTDADLKKNFYKYHDAVKQLQHVSDDHPDVPVALAYCFRQSSHVSFDVDLCKDAVSKAKFENKDYDRNNWREYLPDNQFKEDKIALIEHAFQHHHVRWSTNGGFHVICNDLNGDIEKLANGKEKIGPSDKYLCEVIYRTILFVTSMPANDKPIVNYTPELIDWYRQRKVKSQRTLVSRPLQSAPKKGFQTDIFDDREVSDQDMKRVRDQLKEFSTVASLKIEGASLLLATGDEDRFFQLMKYLVGIISPIEFVTFCRTQPFRLKDGQTEDEYFQGVENRFRSLKPEYSAESQLKQLFAMLKKRAEEVRPLIAQKKQATKDSIKKPLKVSRAKYGSLPIIKPSRPLDVPEKKIVTVFGPSNVGKTSIILHDTVSNVLASGKRVMLVNNDMLHSELRPYIFSFGFKDEYELHVFDEEDVMTKKMLTEALHDIRPHLLIADTLDTMLLQCDSGFSFDSWQTCEAAIGWLKQVIQSAGCGALGVFHTPKAPPNCFGLPHSAKLKGAVFQSWLVMDRNHVEMNNWHRKDIRGLWDNEPSGTVIVYPDKVRAGNKDNNGFFIRFDVEVDEKLTLAGDWRPMLPNKWEQVPMASTNHEKDFATDVLDRPNRSDDFTVEKLLHRIANRAGGVGEAFKIADSEALKTINCYGDRQAPDAKHRRELYDRAKKDGLISVEKSGHKGSKIWVTLNDPEYDPDKTRSQGWQY